MRRMRGLHWAALVVAAGALLAGCLPPAPPSPPPPSGPDLVATDITWPTPLVIGDRVPFSITVSNIGDTATPPNTILDVLITLDVDTPNAADIGWSDNITVPLAPGESRTQVVNGGPDGSDGLWTVDEGAHNVRAYVNSGSLPVRPPIVESNRQNNFYLETFTVEGPPRTDQIVFVGGNGGIWTMHSDGKGLRQLTSDGTQPEVSRDGTKIAYVRKFPTADGRSTYTHIWVMNADGSDQHEVYVAPAPFVCTVCNPPVQLDSPPDTVSDSSPSWSSDGTQMTITRWDRGFFGNGPGTAIMNADASAVRVTNTPGTLSGGYLGGAWSPDGHTIATVVDYVCCSYHIGFDALDEAGVATEFLGIRNGVDGSTIDINPNWSADSTRIAFDGRPNVTGDHRFPGDPGFGDPSLPPLPIGEPGMWIANVTRPFNTRLLAPSPASQPSFSPDGSHIAFTRGTIWTMAADGTDQHDTGVTGSDPSWGP